MDIQNTENLAEVNSLASLIKTTIISLEPLKIKGNIPAVCAISCLVQVREGDVVLCSLSDKDTAYVLAILERLEPAKETLIHSEAPIVLQNLSISLICEKIELVTQYADCNIGKLKKIIESAEDYIGSYTASFRTFFMAAKRSIRRIEELDETRSGHLKLETPTLLEISGAVTSIAGDELIKMQSKQIHMG